MSAAHTPGPWIVAPDKNGECVMTVDGFFITETISCAGHESTVETQYANARLIASAPDLLEALTDARDMLACAIRSAVDDMSYDVREHLGIKKIDAAIKKSTGAAS
jgi:hypothetical protein